MKWIKLYDKIGKQQIKITQYNDVVVLIDGKEIPVELKFKQNGVPYLQPIEKK